MTNPKTLKDLEEVKIVDTKGEIMQEDPLIFKKDLKQEAIQWIKHIEKDIEDIRHTQDLVCNKPLMKVAVDGLDEILEGQIKWIKMFFNIK